MNQIFLGQPVDAIKTWFTTEFPSWPTYTTLKFKDGTIQTKEINGTVTYQNIDRNTNLVYCQLGRNVTSIGYDAFYSCTSLTSISIPTSVTSIGENAFFNCSSLNSIDIPNSVTSIGGFAFNGCPSLTSISIPSSVTSINNGLFFGCYSLPSISIPNSVTSIGGNVFQYCSSLTSITIPSSVISIGYDPFAGIANNHCADYQSLTLVMFAGRTLQQVQAMSGYPWDITDTSIISAELS